MRHQPMLSPNRSRRLSPGSFARSSAQPLTRSQRAHAHIQSSKISSTLQEGTPKSNTRNRIPRTNCAQIAAPCL
eukprot:3617338-Rhodomonas_salina.1